jgi:hypothetical protein
MPSLETMMQQHNFSPAIDPTSTSGPMSVVNPNQARPQLRRAVYIHVSDLISSYNIDHAKLDEELTRVKVEMENPPQPHEHRTIARGVPTELETNTYKTPAASRWKQHGSVRSFVVLTC